MKATTPEALGNKVLANSLIHIENGITPEFLLLLVRMTAIIHIFQLAVLIDTR